MMHVLKIISTIAGIGVVWLLAVLLLIWIYDR